MKKLILITILILNVSCQESKSNTNSNHFPQKGLEKNPDDLHAQVQDALQAEPHAQDDFSDLKKDDEACDTQEDLEKKIEEQARQKQAFKLQGGDEGCTVD